MISGLKNYHIFSKKKNYVIHHKQQPLRVDFSDISRCGFSGLPSIHRFQHEGVAKQQGGGRVECRAQKD